MCGECSSVRESIEGDYIWGGGPCELSVSADSYGDDPMMPTAIANLSPGWETLCGTDCGMQLHDYEELCSTGDCLDKDFVYGGSSKTCNGNTCPADEVYNPSDVSSSISFNSTYHHHHHQCDDIHI